MAAAMNLQNIEIAGVREKAPMANDIQSVHVVTVMAMPASGIGGWLVDWWLGWLVGHWLVAWLS